MRFGPKAEDTLEFKRISEGIASSEEAEAFDKKIQQMRVEDGLFAEIIRIRDAHGAGVDGFSVAVFEKDGSRRYDFINQPFRLYDKHRIGRLFRDIADKIDEIEKFFPSEPL